MLEELLKDHSLYHSEFQQDNFITIKSGGTLYGQYKQALRELYKRFRGLRELYCDKEKLGVEIDEQLSMSEAESNGYHQKRYAEIEHRRKSMQMEEAERNIRDTEREFTRFYQQACALKEQIGDLTEEKRRQHEEELWIYKCKEMMVTDWLCEGRRSRQTHEMLCSLPWKTRVEILEITSGKDPEETRKKQEELIMQFIDEDRNYFNDFQEIEMDVKKCLSEQ